MNARRSPGPGPPPPPGPEARRWGGGPRSTTTSRQRTPWLQPVPRALLAASLPATAKATARARASPSCGRRSASPGSMSFATKRSPQRSRDLETADPFNEIDAEAHDHVGTIPSAASVVATPPPAHGSAPGRSRGRRRSSVTLLESAPDALHGNDRARFELRRVLGRGGAATVYEARDRARGGRVALKLVAEKLNPSPARRARFLREAQLASDLIHPNLVHVVETGEHRGRPSWPWSSSRGWTSSASSERPPLPRGMDDGRPAAGLRGPSLRPPSGLVHGDLKPADMRVNPEGRREDPRFRGGRPQGRSGRGDGRPAPGIHYRAPELIEGRRPDACADVFSVGAIFYELLASQKPFPADTITGVMFRIRHENADPQALPATDFSPGSKRSCSAPSA